MGSPVVECLRVVFRAILASLTVLCEFIGKVRCTLFDTETAAAERCEQWPAE